MFTIYWSNGAWFIVKNVQEQLPHYICSRYITKRFSLGWKKWESEWSREALKLDRYIYCQLSSLRQEVILLLINHIWLQLHLWWHFNFRSHYCCWSIDYTESLLWSTLNTASCSEHWWSPTCIINGMNICFSLHLWSSCTKYLICW